MAVIYPDKASQADPRTDAHRVESSSRTPAQSAAVLAAALSLGLGGHGIGSGLDLLRLLSDSATDQSELVRHIESHPGVAATVMRVANSAYYGRSGLVLTIDHAAMLLGTTTLRAVASAGCFDRLTATVSGLGTFDWPAFHNHSLACACAAKAIAARVNPSLASPMFMTGLLHDLGVLVHWRLQAMSANDSAARNRTTDAKDDPKILSHGACADVLLTAWKLPVAIVAAIAGHDEELDHTLGLEATTWERDALCLADMIAASSGFDLKRDAHGRSLPGTILAQRVGIDASAIQAIVNAVPEDMKRFHARSA